MEIEKYIYKKEVDWSLLHQGFTIPINVQVVFRQSMKNFLLRGQSKDVFLLIDGEKYSATLINQKFDESKYPTHKDILQVRYSPTSELADKFRTIFNYSYIFIDRQRTLHQGGKQKKFVNTPINRREYIAVYMTEIEDIFLVDCIIKNEIDQISNIFENQDEYEFEKTINYSFTDKNAGIEIIEKSLKVRRLDRSIGDSLKSLYNFNCQLCGENFGKTYDVNIVETHHIEPFVKSLNNNSDNQIIICPNHHSVIHCAKPIFDRKKMAFYYTNGFVEKIALNSHL